MSANSLGTGPRLRYPLGYWNANGAMCGIAVAMLLWMSRYARWTALRWALGRGDAGGPADPLLHLLARRAAVALAIGALCMLALSRDRLWLLATLAIAGLGSLPALLAVPDHRSLADNVASQTSVDQGVTVLLILLAGTAVALGLFALLRRLEAAEGAGTRRALKVSRDPAVLKWTAVALAVVAIVAAIAFGGRAWHQFSNSDLNFPTNPAQHFSELSSAGRHDFWRVAIDAFDEKPLLGHGAGTYEFSWEQPALDHHERDRRPLALPGGLRRARAGRRADRPRPDRVLLWVGISAWRAAAGRRREAYAALFAAMLVFAIAAGFDWFWEIAGLGAVFFLAAGALVAARCDQIGPPLDGNGRKERNFGFVIGGVALAWIAAIALVGPLLVEREIKASQAAPSPPETSPAPSTTPTPPARSSPGPPRPTCSSA